MGFPSSQFFCKPKTALKGKKIHLKGKKKTGELDLHYH